MSTEAIEAAESGLEAASRSEELIKTAEEGGAQAFDNILGNIDEKYFSVDSNGEPSFEYNGKKVPLSDLKNDYYDFDTGSPPDFEGLLKKMGFTDDQIKEPGMQKLIKDTKTNFDNKWKEFQEERTRQIDGNKAEKTNPSPKSQDELSKNKNLSKKATEKIKSIADSGSKLGKWVAETVIKLAPYGIAADVLYNIVTKHQEACNGCWKISLADPNKRCKISNLTCSQKASVTGGPFCAPCTKDNGKDCGLDFNPCMESSNKLSGIGNFYNICAPATLSGDPGHTICSDPNIDKNSKNSYYLGPGSETPNLRCTQFVKSPSDDKTNCPTTDDGTWCSALCDCSKSDNCGDGKYTIQCVNMNFWAALSDVVDEPVENVIKWANDVEQNILIVLKYIAIAIVVAIGLFIIIKLFMPLFHKKEESK